MVLHSSFAGEFEKAQHARCLNRTLPRVNKAVLLPRMERSRPFSPTDNCWGLLIQKQHSQRLPEPGRPEEKIISLPSGAQPHSPPATGQSYFSRFTYCLHSSAKVECKDHPVCSPRSVQRQFPDRWERKLGYHASRRCWGRGQPTLFADSIDRTYRPQDSASDSRSESTNEFPSGDTSARSE